MRASLRVRDDRVPFLLLPFACGAPVTCREGDASCERAAQAQSGAASNAAVHSSRAQLQAPNRTAPMPALGPSGVVKDGVGLGAFGIDPHKHYPDVRSHKLKRGVLLPATNTSVEHELWRLVFDNRDALDGVGLHTTPVSTPRPLLRTEADLTAYKRQYNPKQMFEDVGFDVVSTVGFACANALHIAHIPDEAKERAIAELLATKANRLDAVVQCGTNMSFIDVAERLEPRLGLPLLGINAVTFWHALRQQGIAAPLRAGSRVLREH